MQQKQHPSNNRSLSSAVGQWWQSIRPVFRSRIAKKVTTAVFLTILVVEAAILLPSYIKREKDLISALRREGESWILAAATTHQLNSSGSGQEGNGKKHNYMSELIGKQGKIVGFAFVDDDGVHLAARGESLSSGHSDLIHPVSTGMYDRSENRLEIGLHRGETNLNHHVLLRMDTTEVTEELAAFVLRISGLVLLIAGLLTLTTMITISQVVLRPLVRMRENLVDRDIEEWGRLNFLELSRTDEIGELSRAMSDVFKQAFDAHYKLETRVAERTEELQDANIRISVSEKKFQDFAASSADWFWEMDRNLHFCFFSHRFHEMLNIDSRILIGKDLREAEQVGFRPVAHGHIGETLSNHQSFRNFICTYQQENGDTLYLSINGTPHFDEVGNFQGYRGTGRDITEKWKIEDRVHQQQAITQAVLKVIDQGITMISSEGRYILHNKKFCELSGIPEDLLLTQPDHQQLLDYQKIHGDFEHSIETDRVTFHQQMPLLSELKETFGYQVKTTTGAYLDVRNYPTTNGAWVRVLTDISQQKISEDEQNDRMNQLELTLENMGQGLTVYDSYWRLVSYNHRYQDQFDLPQEMMQSHPTFDELMDYVFERDFGEDWLQQKQNVFRSIKDQQIWRRAIIRPNGHGIDMLSVPIPSGGHVVTTTDITASLQSADELRKAKENAERLLKSKGDFVAVVSHEVRTPMNGVLGMASLLQSMELDGEAAEYVNNIVISGQALLTIVDDLLDISKLEAGRLQLENISFNIQDIVENTLATMASRADEKGLELTSQCSDKLPEVVIGDSLRLRQVLLNLLSNAIKFTNSGRVTLETSLEARKNNRVRLGFKVTDTGQGISQSVQDRLFNAYSQGDVETARKYGGTGLGLSICKSLVEMMGGKISVESRPGEGSCFSFTICCEEDLETTLEDLRLEQQPVTLKKPVRKLKVLHVDDNEINLEVIEKMLSRAGHEVINAMNGVDAIKQVQSQPFDIVLMDRHMPGMDGIEATHRLREMPPEIFKGPILGLTAGATQTELDECRQAGMDDVLTKPINEAVLLNRMEDLTRPGAQRANLEDRPRILVVDDTHMNLIVAEKLLTTLHYQCETLSDPIHALDRVKRNEFAAILVDVQMPELDGLEFTRQLRLWERETRRKRPNFIIGVSGRVGQQDRRAGAEAGMDEYLPKPLVLDHLNAVLSAHFNSLDSLGSATLHNFDFLDEEDWFTGNVPAEEKKRPEPTNAPDPDPPPCIDPDMLNDIAGTQAEDQKAHLSLFLEIFPELLDELEAAINMKEDRRIETSAHAAKSAAGSAAAMPMWHCLNDLEDLARGDGVGDSGGQYLTRVRSELSRITEFNQSI
ncbi:response regulator [Aestuariispira insulae]|uniref:histidine kinase n=1 Tax=Aestuariispira insulae TaxID=1461337 RepID=A0A3D9HXM2_9PROT|nr:response regulator [Aestuariispira insulae]RED54244.1 PAS domain S-box-containing protein [Aestuariispira insulae]